MLCFYGISQGGFCCRSEGLHLFYDMPGINEKGFVFRAHLNATEMIAQVCFRLHISPFLCGIMAGIYGGISTLATE